MGCSASHAAQALEPEPLKATAPTVSGKRHDTGPTDADGTPTARPQPELPSDSSARLGAPSYLPHAPGFSGRSPNPQMRKSGSLSITAARGALLALIGPELLAPGGGAPIPTSALQGPSKILCLLFTAQWCTTSSEDMSSLVEYYHQLKDSHPRADCFEFLFVSCDDSRESFQSFREQMPWPAVPFNDDVSVQLSQSLEVLQLPSMLVLHASSGKVLSRDVLEAIEEDGAAVRGDWLTKALGSCLVMA